MNSMRIVTLGPLPEWFIESLGEPYRVTVASDSDRSDVVARLGPDVAALIPRGNVFIDGGLLDRCPNLRAIARTGVGFDAVDIPAASRRRIPVIFTPGAMTESVAEHALGLLLAVCKRHEFWRQRLLEGDWEARYRQYSLDLGALAVGIVGYGRIGRQVRRLLNPFGCRVLACDPYLDPADFTDERVTFRTHEQLLAEANAVTYHVPLTVETREMLHSGNIGTLQQQSIIINTARGEIIESLDLLHRELESGRLFGVGLDVFPIEPTDPAHPLLRHPAAVVTGHVAARSPEAQRRILETVLKELKAILSGFRPTPTNVVNPETIAHLPESPPQEGGADDSR